jgi:hypothetical protein
MEFASLEDAFPQSVNSESKKKKIKRLKDVFQPDPDRPAVKRMSEVRPIGSDPLDEYLDESDKFQNKPTVNNSLPAPRSVNRIEKAVAPKFFGAEPFVNPSDDMRAPFNTITDNANGYMLEADFTKSFDQPGLERSAGSPLPVPELRHRWKPLSSNNVDTAFVNTPKSSQFVGLDTADIAAMKGKIDTLIARLDDIENRASGANPQLEMLSFIMTGLFVMFVLDVAVRKSSGMRLVNVR